MENLRETMDREQEMTPPLPLSLAREASSILGHLNGVDPNKEDNEDTEWRLKIFQIKTKRALAFWRPMFIQIVLKWVEF